jgi:flagellin FlaB
MKRERSDAPAFTGLEAAIVLIAFVVVATVFSFEILGSGFLTTQKSQEVIHTGIEQTSSAMIDSGGIWGISPSGDMIEMVNFTIVVAAGGGSIDFGKVVIDYSNSTYVETLMHDPDLSDTFTTPGTWAIIERRNEIGSSNNLLEKGEFFTISVHPRLGIPPDDRFTIEIKPSKGAPISIQRTAPPSFTVVNRLY